MCQVDNPDSPWGYLAERKPPSGGCIAIPLGAPQPVDEWPPLPRFHIPSEDWSRGFNYEAIGEGHYPDE